MELLVAFIIFFNYFVGIYWAGFNFFYSLMLAGGIVAVLKYIQKIKYLPFKELTYSTKTPPISIIIPAYNEENVILRVVNSALSINYPEFELIVVNDGSIDNTLKLLIDHYKLKRIDLVYRNILKTEAVRGFYYSPEIPNLIVIDKDKGGKSDALNCGINISRYPYFCSIDADCVLERDSLIRLITPVVESTVPVIACSGVVRILTKGTDYMNFKELVLPKKSLLIFQIVEYLRAFLFGRVGLDLVNGLLILSGAFSLFQKSCVISVGGYSKKTVAEDMEIILRLHRYYREKKIPYKIRFIADPICWTEAPEDLKSLARQRIRWQIGLLQSLCQHKNMILNPRYGFIGITVMPYFLFFEALGPFVEFLGYIVIPLSYFLDLINLEFFFLFIFLAFFYGIFLSVGSIFLEEVTYRRYPKWLDLFTLLFYAVLENFGYRQINSLWRFKAVILYLFGKRSWKHIEKKG